MISGGVIGAGVDRGWTTGMMMTVSAQQPGRRNALPAMESLPMEVAPLAQYFWVQ